VQRERSLSPLPSWERARVRGRWNEEHCIPTLVVSLSNPQLMQDCESPDANVRAMSSALPFPL